mgnify:CR=1 FL=1
MRACKEGETSRFIQYGLYPLLFAAMLGYAAFEVNQPVGKIEEDSQVMALLRRFLSNLIPQKYHVTVGQDHVIAHYRQNFNPFVLKLTVALESDAAKYVDPRLLLAGAVLLAAVEGRQQ